MIVDPWDLILVGAYIVSVLKYIYHHKTKHFRKINVDHEPMWPSHSSSVLTGHRCRSCSPVRERSQLRFSSQNKRVSLLLQPWGNSLPLLLLSTWNVGEDICYHQRELKYRVITTSSVEMFPDSTCFFFAVTNYSSAVTGFMSSFLKSKDRRQNWWRQFER
jgi:hypothetical protein